jgi:molybdopterin molybdotransferase
MCSDPAARDDVAVSRPPISVQDALAAVLGAVQPLGAETLAVAGARGRVLAEPLRAASDVPPFDNSAMDGYAVRAGAAGRTLRIAGESRAGAPAGEPLAGDAAMRISTGAPMPEGADAVVPVEQTSESGGSVVLERAARAGDHVRRAGEDMAGGEQVLAPGLRLGPAELGVAVSAAIDRLLVARAPRVAVIATGDELRAPGAALGPGQIHDSNAIALGALAAESGAQVLQPERAGDHEQGIQALLAGALERADVVIASGGVSVGAHDHVKPAMRALGVQEHFWRVALRPGKPTWFGSLGPKLAFGLPGNPVSAMVTFILFVRPALAAMQGAEPGQARRTALLATALARHPDRLEAVRVRLDQDGAALRATPTGPQGSHQTRSMLGAAGLALIGAGEGEVGAGQPVDVILI